MAQAIWERDTLPASPASEHQAPMMGDMTLMAVLEWDTPAPEQLAEVHYLPHPGAPTAEEVAAKKARRRLDGMEQGRDRNGVTRARYFNAAGYDVWGRDARGHYNPAHDIATTPNPFAH